MYVARKAALVEEAKRAGGRLVLRLDVAAPRGAALEVTAAKLPAAEEGSFYVFDLVGLAVEEEGGRALGLVQDVAPGPANDVLELHVAEDDVGKVIGRQGRIARALRTLVRASGGRRHERAVLEIVDGR